MPRIDGANVTRGRTTGALWFSVLAGPLAALAMEELSYMMVPWACHGPSMPLWGTLLHVVPAVLIIVTIVAAITGWRHVSGHPTTSSRSPDTPVVDAGEKDGRIHFMAQLGLWLSLLSLLVLIAEWIPVFVLHPCMFP